MHISKTKIQNILVLAFVFLLPWQTRWMIHSGTLANGYWEYGTLSLYATDILIILTAFFLAWKKPQLNRQTIICTSAIIALLIANIYISLDRHLTLYHIGWLILATITFFAIKQSNISSTKLALTFSLGASLSGFLGVWQFVSQTAFASKWLGLAAHQSAELGVSVIEATAPDGIIERWLRAYGTLDHPNMLGGLMALGLITLVWAILSKHKNDSTTFRTLSLIAGLGLVGGLVASFSRSGWLAAALGLVILLSFYLKNQKAKLSSLIPFATLSILIICLFAIPYSYLFATRFEAKSRLENISIMERVAGYKESFETIRTHPIIGSGLGTYGLSLEKAFPEELVWFYQPVHNSFLLLIAQAGVAGLLLLILACIKFLRSIPDSKKSLAYSLLTSLIIIALFDHWLLSLHAGIVTIAALTGVTIKKD